jgi:hypothetical protein
MQPSNDELHASLAKLHSQLSEVETPTEDVRNLIVQVKADVDRLLKPTEGGKPDTDHDGLSEKLQEAVHRFEDSHPRLTQCLSGIIDVLGQMGI